MGLVKRAAKALGLMLLGAILLTVGIVVMFSNSEKTGSAPAPTAQTEPARLAAPAAEPARAEQPAKAPPEPPQPELALQQRRLIGLVDDFAARYRAAPNDMARGALRPERAAAICKALDGRARDWTGTVETLSSTSGGHGVLAIRIAPNIILKTWSAEFADTGDNTLLQAGSALHRVAAGLGKGDRARFSGTFKPAREDCFTEMSLTVRGAMLDPEYLFRFTALTPVK